MKQTFLPNAIIEPPAVPMRCGGYLYWEAQCKNVVREYLGRFLPNAAYKSGNGCSFKTEFSLFDGHGTDICSDGESLTSSGVKIPRSELNGFISALDIFHKKAEAPNTPDWAREFIRTFAIPDPRFVPNAWRVGRHSNRLFVLWGYHPGNARDVVCPLTPTSSNWPDADNRIDLVRYFESKGRISSSVFHRACFLLCILLGFAAAVLFAIRNYMDTSGGRQSDDEKEKRNIVVTNSVEVFDHVFVTNTITMTNIVEKINEQPDNKIFEARKTISELEMPKATVPVVNVVKTNTVVVTEHQYVTNWINIAVPNTEKPTHHRNGRWRVPQRDGAWEVRP